MTFITVVGIRAELHFSKRCLSSCLGALVAFPLLLAQGSLKSRAAESNPPSVVASHLEETNAQALLQVFLQLQEQLRATQLAVEQSRQETKAAVAQNAEALTQGFQTIQQTLASQRAQDLEAMQQSNKTLFIVAGVFAAMGLLTMLIMTYFQWRVTKGLAQISAALPAALGLGAGSAEAALALANQPELPLLGAMDTLERRAYQLERSTRAPLARREGNGVPVDNPLFREPGALVRRRRFRTVSVALVVGLLCAAGLALLFYVVAYRKLGLG